jgi:Holliday junction resolvase RusA-like endonuclease
MVIDNAAIEKYARSYFLLHKRARKAPIDKPRHPSINEWMIMKRPQMNAVKQKWKDFIVWLSGETGFKDSKIDKYSVFIKTYFPRNNRHDADNTVPKFILDGLVEGGVVIDDDSKHLISLTLECGVDKENPRTEIYVNPTEGN